MNKIWRRLCFAGAMSLAAILSPASAQTSGQSGIVFLYVKMHHDSLFLEKSTFVPGTLKTRQPGRQGDLWYEISSSANQLIAGEWIKAPRMLHYDVPQPDGSLSGGVKPLDDVTFVIRVPYRPDMKELSFFKATRPAGLGKADRQAAVKGACIARFPIVLEGGAQ